jgi:hypothetical protein
MLCVSGDSKFRVKRASERITYQYIRVAQIPGIHVACSNLLRTMSPNICGSLVWNLLHVTLEAPRNFR